MLKVGKPCTHLVLYLFSHVTEVLGKIVGRNEWESVPEVWAWNNHCRVKCSKIIWPGLSAKYARSVLILFWSNTLASEKGMEKTLFWRHSLLVQALFSPPGGKKKKKSGHPSSWLKDFEMNTVLVPYDDPYLGNINLFAFSLTLLWVTNEEINSGRSAWGHRGRTAVWEGSEQCSLGWEQQHSPQRSPRAGSCLPERASLDRWAERVHLLRCTCSFRQNEMCKINCSLLGVSVPWTVLV